MKKIKIVLITFVTFQSFLYALKAQTTLIPAKDKYFGQKPPGMVAELFAPGIISTNAYEHSAPAFAPDGSRVLWAIADRGTYLLEMKYENGVWSKPSRPSFADTTANTEVYPSFSPDGKKLFFSSNRKMPAGFPQDGNNRIWEVALTPSGWRNPVPFDTTASRGQDYANSISNNGTIYFISGIREGTNWNIRKAEKVNGVYTQPVLLPYNINSVGYEDGAYISPDESFLIFESDRADGTNGVLSLFISFKNKNGQWSLPVNMGPQINSGFGERFARLSPDGKYLFFGSFRNPSPEKRGADIYWIDAKIIDELRNTVTAKTIINQSAGDAILTALHKNDRNTAAELFKSWTLSNPGILDAKVIYSSLLRLSKGYIEAEQLFEKLSTLNKDNPKVLMEKGLIKFGLNDEEKAREILAPLLADKNDRWGRLRYLCDELFKMEKYSLSDEFFEKAIAIFTQNHAHYNRACAYALIGNKDKAFALLNTAVEKGFNNKSHYETDTDLVSLRADNRWPMLMQKIDAPFSGHIPYKRAHHELIYDENNKCILMTGGSTPLNGGDSYKFFNDIWCFDGKKWKQTGVAGNERSGMKFALHAKHKKIYSFGGYAGNSSLSDLRVLEKGEWKTIASLPEMKAAEPGFVYDENRDRLIAFGGSSAMGQVNNDTWEWDGANWKKFEGQSPEGRQAFAMVYDGKRKTTVLYGGMDGNGKLFDDGVWEYDGKNWENIKVSGATPATRVSSGYTYDVKNGMLILFGGMSGDKIQNDTWGWDGKEWKLMAASGPSPRAMGYIAYDKNRDKIVLFGGRLGWPNDANDTWEWDGREWKQVK